MVISPLFYHHTCAIFLHNTTNFINRFVKKFFDTFNIFWFNRKHETQGAKSEAHGRKHETQGRKPEAAERKPETHGRKSETRAPRGDGFGAAGQRKSAGNGYFAKGGGKQKSSGRAC